MKVRPWPLSWASSSKLRTLTFQFRELSSTSELLLLSTTRSTLRSMLLMVQTFSLRQISIHLLSSRIVVITTSPSLVSIFSFQRMDQRIWSSRLMCVQVSTLPILVRTTQFVSQQTVFAVLTVLV